MNTASDHKQDLTAIVETLIFASEKPLSLVHLCQILANPPAKQETNPIQETLFQEATPIHDSEQDEASEEPPTDSEEMSYEELMQDHTSEEPDQERTSIVFTEEEILNAIEHLKIKYNSDLHHAIQLVEIGDAFQLRTNPKYAPWIKSLKITRPIKLTKAALEALAIMAYKQPITKSEVDTIRGVDSGYCIKFLVEKKLIKILGKKDVPGKPLLYGTSNEFLSLFGLKNLSSLPTLREFRELTEKHAEKVNELFAEKTVKELKEEAEPLDPFTDEDAETLAEIDETLAETRKVKSVDHILQNEIFREPGEEESFPDSQDDSVEAQDTLAETENDDLSHNDDFSQEEDVSQDEREWHDENDPFFQEDLIEDHPEKTL